MSEPVRAIVLAGERGGGDPFAAALGAPAKVLVDVAGTTSLERALGAVRGGIRGGGVVVGPRREIAETDATCRRLFDRGDFAWLAPEGGPAASALAGHRALGAGDGGVLLTSGDHALLRADTVAAFCSAAAAAEADFVVGLARYADVAAAFPGAKRTVWRFRDEALCGCNLFFLRTDAGTAVLDFWCNVEALRKTPWKIAGRIGWGMLARYFIGALPVAAALETLSRRTGCRVDWVVVDDPHAAVDVDSIDDLKLAEGLLGNGNEDARSQQSA